MRNLRVGSRYFAGSPTPLRLLLALALTLPCLIVLSGANSARAGTLPSITITDCATDIYPIVSGVGSGQSLTVTFAPGINCDYGAAGPLQVNEGASITIVGNGLSIYGGGQSISLISVGSHAGLTLSGTTLWDAQNGIDASSTSGVGLKLTDCVIKQNTASGIDAANSSDLYLIATGTTFSANADNGIGAADSSSPTIVLSDSEFDSSLVAAVNVNTADSPTVSIDESTITNNGSGVAADDAGNASIVVNASTFFSAGSAIYAVSATDSTIVVVNSTIDGGTRGIALGESARLVVNVISSTIANNGLYGVDAATASDPSVTLTATILAGNASGNCAGTVNDGGYNRVTDTSCDLTTSTSQVVSSAALDLQGLAFNGGPTATIALGPTSVAIDQIPLTANESCSAGEQVDQRGVARPQGLACDIGAYEAPGTLTYLPGDTYVVHQGYWALIRIAVLDSNGQNISQRGLHLTALELDGNGQSIPFVHALQFGVFNGQPGYQITINTRNLSPGVWQLMVRIGSNPAPAMVPFTVD